MFAQPLDSTSGKFAQSKDTQKNGGFILYFFTRSMHHSSQDCTLNKIMEAQVHLPAEHEQSVNPTNALSNANSSLCPLFSSIFPGEPVCQCVRKCSSGANCALRDVPAFNISILVFDFFTAKVLPESLFLWNLAVRFVQQPLSPAVMDTSMRLPLGNWRSPTGRTTLSMHLLWEVPVLFQPSVHDVAPAAEPRELVALRFVHRRPGG